MKLFDGCGRLQEPRCGIPLCAGLLAITAGFCGAQTPTNPEALPTPKPALQVQAPAPGNASFSTDGIFSPDVEVMRIDLPTALRIADAGNPTIALARLRVEEAYTRLQQAQLLWLPNLEAAPTYLRHDGEIQNATGFVFPTNKSAVSALGGATLRVDTGDALFVPLIARRLVDAAAATAQGVNNNVQLDVALAYLELLRTYGQLAVNADLLSRDRELLRRTESADKAELAKSGADLNRARTEYQLRIQERIALKGQVRIASSRLARLLLLQPAIALLPADAAIVPVVLVPESSPVDELIGIGVMSRPELSAGRSLVGASEARLRQAELKPLLPRLEASYYAGGFGGGIDSTINNFNMRGDGSIGAVWELRNLGLGNLALNRERRIQVGEANLNVIELRAQVADEVNSALQLARARQEALASAQEAVVQAAETYRKLDLLAFGMTGPRKELDTLEPLLAIQYLAQARTQYLNAVIEYNRAQFQLFTAMGRPSIEALKQCTKTPLAVPTAPAPYQPPPQK